MFFINNLNKSLSAIAVLVLTLIAFTLLAQDAHGQAATPYLSGISQTAATASSVTIQITTSETGDFNETPVFYGAFAAGTSCTAGSNPWNSLLGSAGTTFASLLTPSGALAGVPVTRIDTVGTTDVTITDTSLDGAIICAISTHMGTNIFLYTVSHLPTNLIIGSQTIAFNFPNAAPVITLAIIPTGETDSRNVAFSATDSDAGDVLTFDWKLQANNTTCTAGGYGAAGTPLTTSSGAGTISLNDDAQNGQYICLRVGDGTTYTYKVSNQISGLDTTGPTSIDFINAFVVGSPTDKEVSTGEVLEVQFRLDEIVSFPLPNSIQITITDPQATPPNNSRTVSLANITPVSGQYPNALLKGTYTPDNSFIHGTVTSVSVSVANVVADSHGNANAGPFSDTAAVGEQAIIDTTPITIVSTDVACTTGCVTETGVTYANAGDTITVTTTFSENYDHTATGLAISYGGITATRTLAANSNTITGTITVPSTGMTQGTTGTVNVTGYTDGVNDGADYTSTSLATQIHVDTVAPTFTSSTLLCRVGASGTTPCPNDIATAGDRFFLEHNFSERVNDNNGYTLAGISSSSITAAGFKTTNEALFNVPANGATQGAISTFNVAAAVTDRAGNPFATLTNIPLTPTTFSIDTTPPTAPTVALQSDSGNTSDSITNDGAILITGLEPTGTAPSTA